MNSEETMRLKYEPRGMFTPKKIQYYTSKKVAVFISVRSVKPKRLRRCEHVARMAEILLSKSKRYLSLAR